MTTRCVASWPPATCVWGKCGASPAGPIWRPADQRLLAGAHANLAYVQWDAGDPAGAVESDRQALALRQALAGHVSPLELNEELSLSYHSIGLHRGLAGDYAGALESYQQFLEARERITRADPNSASNQRNLSRAHKRVGAVLIVTGHLSDALAHYRTAEAIDEKRVAADPIRYR
jgi:tetratricopeptide (TPR) repeat protein